MTEPVSLEIKPLRAYLVGVRRPGMPQTEAEEHLAELVQLCGTYGVPVVEETMVHLRELHAGLLLGQGRAEEIAARAEQIEADVVVFDDELSPSQQRNWEKLANRAVIDRREVILGIFADRARTREAVLQVQLARAEYSLPRLKRAWTHLERQRGGGGARGGAGEQQLEVDRRLLQQQIDRLKRELKHVRRVRSTQRQARASVPVPNAALVGYTNAGKSSLLNSMTGAGVLSEDKLFATLDPTTRRVRLLNRQTILLTDTVGFIRKLPHTLVEAFKATLEETQLADLILHVVDASHPGAADQMHATEEVLAELGLELRESTGARETAAVAEAALQEDRYFEDLARRAAKPGAAAAVTASGAADMDAAPAKKKLLRRKRAVLVLNKADLLEDRLGLDVLAAGYEHVVVTSTVTGEGLERLAELLAELLTAPWEDVVLEVPHARADIVARVHREGEVVNVAYEDEVVRVEARMDPSLRAWAERQLKSA